MAISGSYEFRSSTVTQKSNPQTPPHRKVLDLDQTASIVRSPGHCCAQLNVQATLTKMDVRIGSTFQRFLLAHHVRCKTFRGRTEFNGSIAHCNHKCEAAHASLTPNLKDDKMERIQESIKSTGIAGLSPVSKEYIKKRCLRSDEQFVNDENDPTHLNSLISRASKKLCQRSLAADIERIRNSTFVTPRSSNRVDCYMEREIRCLEDQLAEACTNQAMTPEEAMVEFFKKYIARLNVAKSNLELKIPAFERFVELETIIMAPAVAPEERYKDFITEVREFLELKESLSKHMEGTPDIKWNIRCFHKKSIYAVLQGIVQNFDSCEQVQDAIDYYSVVKESHLNGREIIFDIPFVKNDLAIRLEEVKTQLHKMSKAQEDIASLRRLYYGEVQPDGVRRTPKKEELRKQLLEQLGSIVPASEGFIEAPNPSDSAVPASEGFTETPNPSDSTVPESEGFAADLKVSSFFDLTQSFQVDLDSFIAFEEL